LTGKPIYKYRAFEILVTLDLEIYQATRRLIVPENISFPRLHQLLQFVLKWKNIHSHQFAVLDDLGQAVTTLVLDPKDPENEKGCLPETKYQLSQFFPKYKRVAYTYDFWETEIELVRVLEDYAEDSPYRLEAIGQTPPEDM
jgi:hypothetical protein